MKTRKISISGNYRDKYTTEWAGTGTVDESGNVECAADLPEEVYDEIESQIASGKIAGAVNAEEEDDWTVTYVWSLEGI